MDTRSDRLTIGADSPTIHEDEVRPLLLSRVAERVYWAGRYLERAESTARIMAAHTELYLDLPKSAGLGWSPLLAISGSLAEFDRHYPDTTEESVVAFLACDLENPGSIVSTLSSARENMRTTRAVFPRAAWEVLNDLHLRAVRACGGAIHRRARLAFLDDVINGCHQLTGLLAGTMSQDEVHAFFHIGQLVERADMTTRVLDVRAGTLLASSSPAASYGDVIWMGVLRSLSAHQMYRRKMRDQVKGPEVLRFLLQDPQFPRSVDYCLTEISRRLLELGRHEPAMAACADAQFLIEGAKLRSLAWDGLHDYVDEMQVGIASVHEAVAATYFARSAETPQALLATA